MFEVTNIYTLPAELNVQHFEIPQDLDQRIDEKFQGKFTRTRTFSEDGKILTSVTMWVSKEEHQRFLDDPDAKKIYELRKAYNRKNLISTTFSYREV